MSQVLAPFQLLELNVISAQDLAPAARNMRTYAVAWVHPDRKLSTRVDTQGHTNPTWNDKFVFRVDEEFLYEDTSAIMIEIFALHWFKDIHVGTVRVLVGNLIPPPSRPFHNQNRPAMGMRFVALQVRRTSGRPQGILNIGVAVLDSSMRSMPLYTLNSSAVGYRHLMGEEDAYNSHNHLSPHVLSSSAGKPELRRSKSDTSSMVASDVLSRHHHHHQKVVGNLGNAQSVLSSALDGDSSDRKRMKKKGKRKSSKGSVLSGSTLSDSVLRWKLKSYNKASMEQGESEMSVEVEVEPPPPPLFHSRNESRNEIEIVENDHHGHHDHHDHLGHHDHHEFEHIEQMEHVEMVDHNDEEEDHDGGSSIILSITDPATSEMNAHHHSSNNFYEPHAPTMPQYRNSPAPHYRSSPAHPPLHYRSSPAHPPPQHRSSPSPQYMKSPSPPQYMKSPAPQQYLKSPAPQQYMKSPAPQYVKSPAPKLVNSPVVKSYKNSPKPQFMNSPKPQFKSSPAVAPQFRSSPVVGPQLRSSPAVSKFNPAVGFGGSNRGTPMHPFGRLSGAAFDQYGTPRRSNLGNIGPPVVTESELGPSPSEVAAAIARKPVVEDAESSMGGWSLDEESVEGLQSKLERWRTELPPVIDNGGEKESSTVAPSSVKSGSRHSRRHTEGNTNNGLFSCFSNICGIECSIVCGGESKGKNKKKNRRRSSSADNATSLV